MGYRGVAKTIVISFMEIGGEGVVVTHMDISCKKIYRGVAVTVVNSFISIKLLSVCPSVLDLSFEI